MHAFLIVGENLDTIEKKIVELVTKFNARKYEFELQKVQDIKELTGFTKLSLREPSVLVVRNIDTSSTEAQNTFLKTLEEPQKNLRFILTAINAEAVLSTILSRVEIVSLHEIKIINADDVNFAREFFSKTTGEKLEITSKIRKREEAVELIESLIRGGHQLMLQSSAPASFVESAQTTFEALKMNGNVQIQLTNFVLQVSP